MLNTRLPLLFALLLLVASAHAQTDSDATTESIQVDGVEREWRMYVPPSYQEGSNTALVIDIHGSGGEPNGQAGLSQFEALAKKEGFLVATPAGKYIRPDANIVSWNVYFDEDGVDDVQFIREMIGRISEQYSVDSRRVFAAGMSGGGRMSSRLGCDLGDLIAAIAPVTGVQFPVACNPVRPVPVITFHGRLDNVNHYELRDDSPPYWSTGVEKSVSDWVSNNGCKDEPVEEQVTAEVIRISYIECEEQADIVFYRSENAGHTWPGSPAADVLESYGLGLTNRDIPATELIWEFFQAHPLQAESAD